jgi:hypothetical protein
MQRRFGELEEFLRFAEIYEEVATNNKKNNRIQH